MARRPSLSKWKILSPTAWKIRIALWGGAVLVGLAATLFAFAADKADHFFAAMAQSDPLLTAAISPIGLMLIAWLTRRYFPGSQGSGIPQTLATMEVRAGEGVRRRILSVRVAIGKIILTVLGLFSGASIGREGPTVHIGAAIMFNMGRWVRFPPHYMERALILGGGAAGISAAFNTPLAGVVFAIEEISRSFEERTNGIVITAVLFAGVTALAIQGNYNYFGSSTATFTGWEDWMAIPVCGVVGGLFGGLFSQSLVWGSQRLAPLYRRSPVRVAGVCGLVVGLIGLLSAGASYGTGYVEATSIISEGVMSDPLYPLYKLLATVASYLSGIPGGIFAPSLSVGAGLGADMSHLLPGASASLVIILAMVAYFTGVVQTPITAFVIVMEMTDNHGLILPLMATAFIAKGVSSLVCPQPIYRALATYFLSAVSPTKEPEGPTGGNPAPERSV
jgi:H+/Cl- antiporter ClcA